MSPTFDAALPLRNRQALTKCAPRHDVSWGTKGSDKVDALPAATSKKEDDGKDAVVEVQEMKQADIDLTFKETVMRAVAPIDTHEERVQPTMDDQNKTFRTRFIMVRALTSWLRSRSGADRVAQGLAALERDPRLDYQQAWRIESFALFPSRVVDHVWSLRRQGFGFDLVPDWRGHFPTRTLDQTIGAILSNSNKEIAKAFSPL